MKQWYFSHENQLSGPFDLDYAKSFVREHPGAYCWQAGWPDWRLVFEVPEIRRMKKDGVTPFPPPSEAMISPKPRTLPHLANQVTSAVAFSPASPSAPPATKYF